MAEFYSVLEVPKTASEADIRSAYRKAAMRWHPDRNQGSKESEEKFKEVAQAYSVLSSPQKRQQYDAYLAAGGAVPAPSNIGFDPDVAARMFIEEMFSLAAELTMQNVPWREIGAALIARGCPDALAHAIALQVEAYRKANVRSAAGRAFGWAIMWMLLGGVVTGCTYTVARNSPQGGTYFVTWGLFVVGGWQLLRAIYYLVTGEAPSRRD